LSVRTKRTLQISYTTCCLVAA